MKRLGKLSLVVILILSFTLSPLFASPASAQWIVFDPANFANTTMQTPVKDYGLDGVAWFLVNMIIERIAASTVNWINSGFQGKPAFITNPDTYFKNIADGVAGQVIYNHPDLRFMCSPFKLQVQLAVARTYAAPPRQFQCTLSQVVNNWEGFMNDFSQGGWDGFIEITQKSQNNPLGLYVQFSEELQSSITKVTGQKKDDLNWGKGFLSYKKCTQWRVYEAEDEVGNPYDVEECTREVTETPGTVIENSLNDALDSGNNRLQAADEINEIISALLNQLISKALGGLRGLTRGSSTNNEPNYLDQLYNATASTMGVTSIPAVNGQCPDSYTLDTSTTPAQCITTSRIQNTLTTAQNMITAANNMQNCLIERAAASGLTIADPSIIAQCESQVTIPGGSGGTPTGPTTSVTGPGFSNGTCGSMAGNYTSGASLTTGNFCYNSTLATPISNIPSTVPSSGFTWQCERPNGTTFSCSATTYPTVSCGTNAGSHYSIDAGNSWSGTFCNNGAAPIPVTGGGLSGIPSTIPNTGTSASWMCPITSGGGGYSTCTASVAPAISTGSGGSTFGNTLWQTIINGGSNQTGTGGTGTQPGSNGGTGNPYTIDGTDGGSHNLGSTAMTGACGPASGSYTADWSDGFYGDLCGAGATLNGNAPQFPAPGESALWFCNGYFNSTPRTFDCTAVRAAQ